MDQITITLPLTERGLWVILSAIGLAAATGLVWLTLSEQDRKTSRTPLSWLIAFGWVLLPLWLAIFCATLWQVWGLLTGAGSILTGPGSLGAGALIAALLGAPFVIWGTVLRQRAVILSETALFNDKINAVLEGLYSRRQITRTIIVGDEEKILTEWQDDIVQRNGAMGLARERPPEAQRIANILSVYVRELSKQSKPQTHPRQKWVDFVDLNWGEGIDDDDALAQLGLSHDDIYVAYLNEWTRGLRSFRTDVENATQALGRLQEIPGGNPDELIIDLRGANLQGFDLESLCFCKARLTGARMEGANLSRGRMEHADLDETHLEGAKMGQAQVQKANLNGARLEGAYLSDIDLQDASLLNARMAGAHMIGVKLDGADIMGAKLEGVAMVGAQLVGVNLMGAQFSELTNWATASLCGANIRFVDLSNTPICAAQVNSTFGDRTTLLPDMIPRPAHWPDWELPFDGPHAFDTEWRKWRSNPDAYTTPQKPD